LERREKHGYISNTPSERNHKKYVGVSIARWERQPVVTISGSVGTNLNTFNQNKQREPGTGGQTKNAGSFPVLATCGRQPPPDGFGDHHMNPKRRPLAQKQHGPGNSQETTPSNRGVTSLADESQKRGRADDRHCARIPS